MRATFNFDPNSLKQFNNQCSATITKVGNGSRKALIEACEEILEASLAQVPIETTTLMSSASYEITGYYKTGWDAKIGYGISMDPINPVTGKPASYYALYVHEDLTASHPVGKAKFLEDPIREYAARKFPRTVFKYAQESLAGM